MSNARCKVVDGTRLACPCGGMEFRLNNYSTAYSWQHVNGDKDSDWAASYWETDPEISEDWSSDGYEWECTDCGQSVPSELSDALDAYVDMHMLGPERAARAITNEIIQIGEKDT